MVFFRALDFVLGPVLDTKKIAMVTVKATEDELNIWTDYNSDLEEAGNDDVKVDKVQARHVTAIGGNYFADCALAIKASHPLPSPPRRWNLGDVKNRLACIVNAWPLRIRLMVATAHTRDVIA